MRRAEPTAGVFGVLRTYETGVKTMAKPITREQWKAIEDGASADQVLDDDQLGLPPVCPRCGEPLTDECDPNFCEGCVQDFPMKVACWDTYED